MYNHIPITTLSSGISTNKSKVTKSRNGMKFLSFTRKKGLHAVEELNQMMLNDEEVGEAPLLFEATEKIDTNVWISSACKIRSVPIDLKGQDSVAKILCKGIYLPFSPCIEVIFWKFPRKIL